MSSLTWETNAVQNPALGSVLIWRFVCGYVAHHKRSDQPSIPLTFIVLPIAFHQETLELLQSTTRPSGLYGYADKFSRAAVSKSDILLGIQTRALTWRKLTWESVQLGVQTRLITMSPLGARVIPVTTTKPRGVPASLSRMIASVEKLGAWCSEMSLYEVGAALKVGF